MYETSLDSYLRVFLKALHDAKRDQVLRNRLRNMIETITVSLYDYTCLGIFEKHKLMFSFQMTTMLMDGDGELDRASLNFFLKGDASLDEISVPKPPKTEWLADSGWKDFLYLGGGIDATAKSVSKALRASLERFRTKPELFKAWYDLESPELVAVPGDDEEGLKEDEILTPIENLCVVRCFRPDRSFSAVTQFIIRVQGEHYVQPPSPDSKTFPPTISIHTKNLISFIHLIKITSISQSALFTNSQMRQCP